MDCHTFFPYRWLLTQHGGSVVGVVDMLIFCSKTTGRNVYKFQCIRLKFSSRLLEIFTGTFESKPLLA